MSDCNDSWPEMVDVIAAASICKWLQSELKGAKQASLEPITVQWLESALKVQEKHYAAKVAAFNEVTDGSNPGRHDEQVNQS